jgi:hypothetical protein
MMRAMQIGFNGLKNEQVAFLVKKSLS